MSSTGDGPPEVLENEPRRRRLNRAFASAVIVAIAVGFGAGYLVRANVGPSTSAASPVNARPTSHPSTKTVTARGAIAIESTRNKRGFAVEERRGWVTHCEGVGPYATLRSRAPFTVSIGTTRIVGGGALGPGIEQVRGSQRRCLFRFSADHVPYSPSYVVKLVHAQWAVTAAPSGEGRTLTVVMP